MRGQALVSRDGIPSGTLALLSVGHGIVPVQSPDPAVVEGFLRLSSHVLLKAQREPFRTVGVTSATRGEGKTTTALNLAICLGRTQGRVGRVLLVDGDTRGRTLTTLVAGHGANGDSEEPDPLLMMTSFAGVDLMTAPTRSDSLTLYDPTAWGHALRALASRYRMVVVDCPAVLASPDGLVLPTCVDEVIMVVAAGRTSRDEIGRALEAIDRAPLGMVLNGGVSANPDAPGAP
jgi:Mrp family chromosome partitioning ATPase